MSIRVHGLRLPQTCYGMLHVMNTHTHRPIHNVTVVCLLPDGLFDCCQTLSPRVCSEKKADDRATLYLSVSKPTACLLPDAWCLLPDSAMEEPTIFVCLLLGLLVKLIRKREMNISAQSLRLPRTRPGMLHVIDTHRPTHHRIYSVTVDYASPPC